MYVHVYTYITSQLKFCTYMYVCTYFVHRQFYSGSHFIHRSPLTIQSAEYFLKSLLSLVLHQWMTVHTLLRGGRREGGREREGQKKKGERERGRTKGGRR